MRNGSTFVNPVLMVAIASHPTIVHTSIEIGTTSPQHFMHLFTGCAFCTECFKEDTPIFAANNDIDCFIRPLANNATDSKLCF